MAFRILVASYTNEITTLSFDPTTGTLKVVSAVTVGHQPSWITPHPEESSLIFTVLEQSDGKVVVVKYDESWKGQVVAEAPSGGQDPCSLLATNDELLITNYSSGSFSTLPISSKAPYLLEKEPSTTQLLGSGPNKERQETSHAHQVFLLQENQELLVADLGGDKVWRFVRGEDKTWKSKGHVQYEAGGGPRHVAFYDGILYTLLELTSSLVKHRFPPLPAEPTLIDATSTLSKPLPLPNDMLAAEILIPLPNSTFSDPYIYISNRNDPSPDGDTIAIFAIQGEQSALVTEVRTGLKHVRAIVFGGPDDKWLVAGGVHGGGVKVFERIDGGKNLRQVAVNAAVEAPTGFLWV